MSARARNVGAAGQARCRQRQPVACRRGSITRSVRYQPTPMTSRDEAVVNPRLLSGLTTRSGSRICAACWVKPCSSGSMPEGMKLAENPPETPAKAAEMPARGCRPAA